MSDESYAAAYNKSGFEIRADLLNLAQGLLELNAQRQIDAAHFAADQAFNSDTENTVTSLPVIEITPEDIINTARQFNAFINEK